MVRSDFVSNSSSSSFVVWGMYLDVDELKTLLKNSVTAEEYEKCCDEVNSVIETIYDKEVFDKIGVDYCRCCDDTFVVGLHPEEQKEDETLLQFKQKIAGRLFDGGLKTEASQIKLISGINSDGEFCEE